MKRWGWVPQIGRSEVPREERMRNVVCNRSIHLWLCQEQGEAGVSLLGRSEDDNTGKVVGAEF